MLNPAFLFETALLLSVAYAIGCALGYFGRAALQWLHRRRMAALDEALSMPVPQAAPAAIADPAEQGGPAADAVSADAPPKAPASAVEAPSSGQVEPPATDAPPFPTGDEPGDDLTRIKGIGPRLAARLADLGIARFEQIAAWNPDHAAEISRTLGFPGRVLRDRWVEQARDLCADASRGPGPA